MDKNSLKSISKVLFSFLVVNKEQNHSENYILLIKTINFSQFIIAFSPGIFQNFPRGTGSQKFDFPRGSPPRGSPGFFEIFTPRTPGLFSRNPGDPRRMFLTKIPLKIVIFWPNLMNIFVIFSNLKDILQLRFLWQVSFAIYAI